MRTFLFVLATLALPTVLALPGPEVYVGHGSVETRIMSGHVCHDAGDATLAAMWHMVESADFVLTLATECAPQAIAFRAVLDDHGWSVVDPTDHWLMNGRLTPLAHGGWHLSLVLRPCPGICEFPSGSRIEATFPQGVL
jgi:hypothetical protein